MNNKFTYDSLSVRIRPGAKPAHRIGTTGIGIQFAAYP